MDLKARPVEPITDRAMPHETFKKLGSTSNSCINFWMFNTALFGKNERKETRQPSLIESTITTQSSMNFAPVCDLPSKAMSPCPCTALPHGNLNGILANRRKNILVTRGKEVLGQKQVVIPIAPTNQSTVVQTDFKIGLREFCLVEVIANKRMIFFLSRCQKCQSLISKSPPIFLIQ